MTLSDNGNKYALAALKERRAKIAGEIFSYRKRIKERLKQLATLDNTIRMFDPEYKEGSIRAKRYVRAPLFGQGELGRVILDVMREAKGEPMRACDIASRAMVKLGVHPSAQMAITSRVSANLRYLGKYRHKVAKTGEKGTARWTLAHEAEP
jgi:hypothetical protein